MVDVRLNVPLVDQHGVKTTKSGSKAVQNACWYAAACMVSYYFRPGPRWGLPQVWQRDQGLGPGVIEQLCIAEGLMPLDQPTAITAKWLADILQTAGPIWAAGYFLGKDGHVIVITGVDDGTVYYNDPEGPPPRTMLLATLDDGRWRPNGLLVKDPERT